MAFDTPLYAAKRFILLKVESYLGKRESGYNEKSFSFSLDSFQRSSTVSRIPDSMVSVKFQE